MVKLVEFSDRANGWTDGLFLAGALALPIAAPGRRRARATAVLAAQERASRTATRSLAAPGRLGALSSCARTLTLSKRARRGACSANCGTGTQTRTCTGGTGCPGVSQQSCNTQPCGTWSNWSVWRSVVLLTLLTQGRLLCQLRHWHANAHMHRWHWLHRRYTAKL